MVEVVSGTLPFTLLIAGVFPEPLESGEVVAEPVLLSLQATIKLINSKEQKTFFILLVL